MEKNVRLKIFNRFLKENNLLRLFYYNLENDENHDFNHKTIDRLYEKLELSQPNYEYYNEIHQAFFWNGTKQGYNFWVKIEKKWLIILSQYINGIDKSSRR